MKILLGLSGGVDSTYAVHRLMCEGHTVEGAILHMHEYTELDDAQKSAEILGIPLHVIDCRAEFERVVKENLISEYLAGRTPNPCIVCNSEIKFVYLYEYAMEHGFDAIATGHYARLVMSDFTRGTYREYNPGDTVPDGEHVMVARGADERKDQSYMLWRVPEYILRRLVLPLGGLQKEYVKSVADEKKLVAKDRRESQEICFIREGTYVDFIESRVGKCERGVFVSDSGEVLGEHEGIIKYTIGQRKGLGISAKSRIFVTDIDPHTNRITLSDVDKLYSSVKIKNCNFSIEDTDALHGMENLTVKFRYAHRPTACKIEKNDGGTIEISLASPQRAICAGQSAVIYNRDAVIGGGFIEKAE